jgi:hypothetical protein
MYLLKKIQKEFSSERSLQTFQEISKKITATKLKISKGTIWIGYESNTLMLSDVSESRRIQPSSYLPRKKKLHIPFCIYILLACYPRLRRGRVTPKSFLVI